MAALNRNNLTAFKRFSYTVLIANAGFACRMLALQIVLSHFQHLSLMQLKDYYKTLRVQPTATQQQVRISFRQLAHLYHPDKNPGNVVAEAAFREIKEAYETVGDPQKREAYNYKRWYSRTVKDAFAQEQLTPAAVLRESVRLNEYLQTVNTLRVDFDGLSHHIRQLLSDTNTGILQQAGDETINSLIIQNILQSASLLPFEYIAPIASLLSKVAGNNQAIIKAIDLFVQQQQQKNAWQNYKTIFVIVLTMLICWIIYRVSN